MDEVFKALADPNRRRLLDSLNARNGQTLRELCAGLAMARQSVSKHLAVLEAANLITTRRSGREKLHYLNAEPINAITERWITRYDRARVHALADLKKALKGNPMSDNTFVYTTYIKTTPEKLWQALTDPAFTDRYWGASFDTDWQPGAEMVWHQRGWSSKDAEQVVLEANPYTRLAYTWHTFDPAFADTMGMDKDRIAAWAREPRSKVSFELEPTGEVVKLTVVHDGFGPGSTLLTSITEGWPSILASLKTLLETGEVLPEPAATK
ncbi:ArsR/SmtB family transcription factor [Nocardia sp. NPDC049149]|uniref:ArsR/SmtB family transcription factor n=1 Tax=Nocardia sp. NPDC049149 TaxID=3364315 RepID=UPI0037158F41